MISAVDTSILLDVFRNDPAHCAASARILRDGLANGKLVICDIVWSE